tara:strand:+ start:300 stop:479 length:180 start_codon:yes stop_codon:yes gene_type:complete
MTLASMFSLKMDDFPANNDCIIESGPKSKKLGRGEMGREWKVLQYPAGKVYPISIAYYM